jgi:hypothetical protein
MTEDRKIDITNVYSAHDAIQLILNSMLAYKEGLGAAFGDANTRMEDTVTFIENELQRISLNLFLSLETTDLEAAAVQQKAAQFNDSTTQTLSTDSDKVVELERSIHQNQTAIDEMVGDLRNRITQFEDSLRSNETSYEDWLDSRLSSAMKTLGDRKAELKAKLASTSSSFIQQPARIRGSPHSELNTIKREVEELRRRALLSHSE